MTKITLTDLANLQNETTAVNAINTNNATLETFSDSVLSRDGTAPNEMESALDMNNHQILNLPNPTSSTSPLRLQDLQDFWETGTITTFPAGGITGDILAKASNADYDVEWIANSNTFFNVKDYGATGDGVTNDTTAIQAAITALAAGIDGGTLFFPRGDYLFNSTLNFDNTINVQILGESGPSTAGSVGTVLRYSGSGTAISARSSIGFQVNRVMVFGSVASRLLDLRSSTTNTSSAKVWNSTFYHSNSGSVTTRICVDIDLNENFKMHDCTVSCIGCIGISGAISVTSFVIGCHLNNIVFPSASANSLPIVGPSNTWLIENCIFEVPATFTCIAKGFAGKSTTVTLLSNWFGDTPGPATGPIVTTNSENLISIGNNYASSKLASSSSCIQMDNSSGSIVSIGDYLEADIGFVMGTGNSLTVITSSKTHTPTTMYTGTLVSDVGNIINVPDANFFISDDADPTKLLKFSSAGITTGTTRTLTAPDADTTIVGHNTVQTLSNKSIGNTNVVALRDDSFSINGSSDSSKILRFEVDGFTTGNTRTLTPPDASTTIVGTDTVQTLSNKTFVAPALGTPASGVVTNLTGTASININGTVGATTPTTGVFTSITGSSATISGVIRSSSPSGGVGYVNGAGGTVVQATDKSTGVTLNTCTGQITMNSASLASGTSVGFTVTNSQVVTTDCPQVCIKSGGTLNAYDICVDAVGTGSFHITIRNRTGGALAEALVLQFVIIRGATS